MANTKTDLRKAIDEFCDENWPDEGIILFGESEGSCYDEGFIGIGMQQHKGPVAVYDRDKCIDALAWVFRQEEFAEEGSDPYGDAVEWFDYNTAGAWAGERTPVIITKFSAEGTR